MIQKANVGVGISGAEGLQAACASDYSIAQVIKNHNAVYDCADNEIIHLIFSFGFCCDYFWFMVHGTTVECVN